MNRKEHEHFLAVRRCQQWNRLRLPAGAVFVRYYPILTRASFEVRQTSSEAWPLASGESVVRLDGKSGAVSLDAIEVCTAEEAAEAMVPDA